jgi:hypothetical protein
MTVNIIRRTAETHEVTKAMLLAATELPGRYIDYADIYKAMEAARVAESGEIERIEVTQKPDEYDRCGKIYIDLCSNAPRVVLQQEDDRVIVNNTNLRPLADALLELDKQINGGK